VLIWIVGQICHPGERPLSYAVIAAGTGIRRSNLPPLIADLVAGGYLAEVAENPNRYVLIIRSRERDLSCEDARQIINNIVGFFAILADWSRAEMRVPANDIAKPSAPDPDEVSDER
jgi:hypothetical protein